MDAILAKLESLKLSPMERRRLRDALDVELTGARDNFTDFEHEVWNAIQHVLHIRLPLDTFLTRSKYGKRAYTDDAFQVEQFVTDHCGLKLTKIERMSVLASIMRCMLIFVAGESQRDRVTPAQMLSNLYLIEQAVDDQYPGYASAGVLRQVLISTPMG